MLAKNEQPKIDLLMKRMMIYKEMNVVQFSSVGKVKRHKRALIEAVWSYIHMHIVYIIMLIISIYHLNIPSCL